MDRQDCRNHQIKFLDDGRDCDDRDDHMETRLKRCSVIFSQTYLLVLHVIGSL